LNILAKYSQNRSVKPFIMNIVVNGGSRGIGRELVLFLARDKKNKIVVTGRDILTMEAIFDVHPNIYPFRVDLSDNEELSELYVQKVSQFIPDVDILINMAGTLVSRDFSEISDNEARLIMETNFFGPATVIRVLKPLMNRGSHIVNISSMGGYQGSVKFRGLSYYSASKAAIACLSECLAEEFRDDEISVNCIALGAVQTEMLSEAFPGYQAPVSAGQVAPFIAYFALNGQKFMNGKILPLAMGNP
jgi:NAD(P)-dependent dehydrogenase (short-subunit alcohol dehydrogenase family)